MDSSCRSTLATRRRVGIPLPALSPASATEARFAPYAVNQPHKANPCPRSAKGGISRKGMANSEPATEGPAPGPERDQLPSALNFDPSLWSTYLLEGYLLVP